MSKQELIEKAVNIFNGKWPSKSDLCVYMYKFESENIWECGSSSFDSLFTREEFNAAADRMRGKPDWSILPAKAEWLAQDRCGIWKPMQGRRPTIEGGSYWVTDHHLQPQLRGTVIGDWRNTLEKRPEHIGDTNEKVFNARTCWPPVAGMTVELWFGGQYVENVEFLCERGGNVIFWRYSNDSVDSAAMPTAELKPIRTEREKAIEAAVEAMQPNSLTGTMTLWFGKLYDAGLLRLPDQK